MNKYLIAREKLDKNESAIMTVFGNSMLPIIKSGSTLEFKKFDSYEIGDIVFCKVNSRYIDAHKIVKKDDRRGYLIANNHGHENGWTRHIYGKVVKIL